MSHSRVRIPSIRSFPVPSWITITSGVPVTEFFE